MGVYDIGLFAAIWSASPWSPITCGKWIPSSANSSCTGDLVETRTQENPEETSLNCSVLYASYVGRHGRCAGNPFAPGPVRAMAPIDLVSCLVSDELQALTIANTLPASGRNPRRQAGPSSQHQPKCGYGVGDDMDSILAKYTKRRDRPSVRDNPLFRRQYHPHAALPQAHRTTC